MLIKHVDLCCSTIAQGWGICQLLVVQRWGICSPTEKKKKQIPGGWPGGCITEDPINKLFHFFVGFVGNQSQTHDAGDTNGQHQKLVVHVVSKCLCLYIYCVCVFVVIVFCLYVVQVKRVKCPNVPILSTLVPEVCFCRKERRERKNR